MSDNLFNETQKTWFQMKPYIRNAYDSRCVFCHQGFDIDSVLYISDVTTVATGLYTFEIELYYNNWNKTLSFEFERKVDVIKGHREFCRAYKKIEEFKYVPTTKEGADVRSAGMDDSPLADI